MSRRSGLAGAAILLAGPVFLSGCAGLSAAGAGGRAPELAAADAGAVAAAPELASDVSRRLPGAAYSSIFANGMAWIGYNVATAEAGDLEAYDNGDGAAFGVAFGDGQNLKRFFEIAYESTGGHRAFDAAGAEISRASHERYYAGLRRYLFPPSEEGGGRVVPFVTGGATFQTLTGSGQVTTDSGSVAGMQGSGIYLGTGLEFKMGSSSQVALALEVRGSFITYDGSPEGTGRQASVGSAMALVLHF